MLSDVPAPFPFLPDLCALASRPSLLSLSILAKSQRPLRLVVCSSLPRCRSCLPRNLSPAPVFTAPSLPPTLAVVKCIGLVSLLILAAHPTCAQQKPPEVPAQIELLETRVRFESNGDSRKEIHARVKIKNELGARQFARLNFDYNRAFEQVEMPLVRVTHPSGGTSDLLPSAITDNPNPAVANFSAYQDVRVKSVRILGLGTGDLLEYRVITAVSHYPLEPDFWLDHSFDRTGVVSKEIFELDLPSAQNPEIRINPATPPASTEKSGEGDAARVIYRWEHFTTVQDNSDKDSSHKDPDVLVTTFATWALLSEKLDAKLQPFSKVAPDVEGKARELTRKAKSYKAELEAIYDFVSQRITTVDLPLGSTNFHVRPPGEILSSGVATPEDKYTLLSALATAVGISTNALLTGAPGSTETQLPTPKPFTHLLVGSFQQEQSIWLDPTIEVAPFGMIPSNFRGKPALKIENWTKLLSKAPLGNSIHVSPCWQTVESSLPFGASQKVNLDASLTADGKLTAKVHYSMRGDNELLLRVAFHQSPKEKWKDLAQLLALTDGFRGQIANTNASDPYATKDPFTVEYEISQPKFVDWSKKPVRIPAILPLVSLPDPPVKAAPGAAPPPIDLGTPLDVEAHVTLHLPVGATATAPIGTSVARDYARFSSSYSAQATTISAARHLHFLLREIPAARAADYNAFLRAVQNDQAQEFTLERSQTPSPKTNSAAPVYRAPPKPYAQKP